MTIEATEAQVMTEREATQLTEKIRITAHNYADARQKLTEYVAQAKAGSAHIALGKASWQAYLSEVLGEEPMRLARDVRPEMARLLSDQDLSTRAIGTLLGVHKDTVRNDLKATGENSPVDKPRVSHGLDGKTRTHQPAIRNDPKPDEEEAEPAKPKRTPLPDQFFNATYDLGRNMDRLKKLIEDDRFPANKEKITLKHKSDLLRLADALSGVLQAMN